MRNLIVLGLFVLLMCSCHSRIPEPVAPPYSQQTKLQAAQHWELVAGDLAARISSELIRSDNADRAVFVNQTCGNEASPCRPYETSSFNEAFRDLLITKLFDLGVPTSTSATTDTIDIFYKVQVVHHNAKRVRTLQPGLLTALSAAILVLRNAPTEVIVLASGAAADVANANLVSSSSYEAIITTSMISGGRYLFRASDIYYINGMDSFHYQQYLPPAKTIRLSTAFSGKQSGYCINVPMNAASLGTTTSANQPGRN